MADDRTDAETTSRSAPPTGKRTHPFNAVFGILAVASFIFSIFAMWYAAGGADENSIFANEIKELMGIAIGAIALVVTVGALVLGIPVWQEHRIASAALSKTEEARLEAESLSREAQKLLETLKADFELERERLREARAQLQTSIDAAIVNGDKVLSDRMGTLSDEIQQKRSELDSAIEELNSPYSRYTGIYHSMMLFNTVIRYIGQPLWDESEPNETDEGETELERVDRHVSMVRQLVSALAITPQESEKEHLSYLRDAVGHLRKTDDQIFFDFLAERLDAFHPKNETRQQDLATLRDIFDMIRSKATLRRLGSDPLG